jgi:hypothetical protein
MLHHFLTPAASGAFSYAPQYVTAPQQLALHQRRASMCTSDDAAAEARRRWLERSSGGNSEPPQRPPEDDMFAAMREREEARKRMIKAMGGDGIKKIHSGMGTSFGFGAVDDENYGYGDQQKFRQFYDKASGSEEETDGMWPEWLTSDPVGAASTLGQPGNGFDGRSEGWARKPDMTDPNPPRMPNTLRGPRGASVAVQSFKYDLSEPGQEEEQVMKNATQSM